MLENRYRPRAVDQDFFGGGAAEGGFLPVDVTVTMPASARLATTWPAAPSGRPELLRNRKNSGDWSITRARRNSSPTPHSAKVRLAGVSNEPSERGIGSPCGSAWDGPGRRRSVDQPVADRVFHVLGFFVHFVPGQVQRLDQKQLDQPMPAHDPQRQGIAGRGQPHALVRRVGDQVALAERLEHAGHGARRNAQCRGQLAGGRLAIARQANLKDRLDVVFDG